MPVIPRKVMMIVNPASGGGKSLDILPEADRTIGQLGIRLDIRISDNPSHATEMARSAALYGYERVIALGGDGTINMVATGIAGSETTLGVIPAGNGNDFFRLLGVEKKLVSICRAAVFGEPTLFDVGIFNDRLFFNMLGIGFDARVAMEVKKDKQNLGLASYLIGVYKILKSNPSYKLRLRIDRLEIVSEVLLVAVGIGRSAGSGFFLTPQAVVNDGKFDVCVARHAKPLRILSLLPLVFMGKHVRKPEVTMYRCRQLEISSDKPLPIHYEGETLTTADGKVSIKMSQEKLKVATGIKVSV